MFIILGVALCPIFRFCSFFFISQYCLETSLLLEVCLHFS
jgi:hypothetical protein